MDFESFNDISLLTILIIGSLSFVAGFIDSIVGGGGLIMIPTLLIQFPQIALPTIFGTNKIAALSGTSVAAYRFAKKIKFDYILLLTISITALLSSYLGAQCLIDVDPNFFKPIILILLVVIFIYTFLKKDFGNTQKKHFSMQKKLTSGIFLGILVGFYDGFFGPGTGSFFVLGFILLMGFDFIEASAYSKIINCVTNLSALFVFISNDNYIFELAIIMAIFNVLGNFLGSTMALKKGNTFIRMVFLGIISMLIVKYGYDIFSV